MSRSSTAFFVIACHGLVVLPACGSEELAKQAEIIRQQKVEIARQQKVREELIAERKKEENCLRAFRDFFDKTHSAGNREEAISLYRQGLAICPEDDVAHYELGRALVDAGRSGEAANSFEAALKINPDFSDARRQLDAIRKQR